MGRAPTRMHPDEGPQPPPPRWYSQKEVDVVTNEPTEQNATAAPTRDCSAAEAEVCACWVGLHGDPADWSAETHQAYENTLRLIHGSAL